MPMISDLDIYRSANILVKRHAEDPPIQAAMVADATLDKGVAGLSIATSTQRA